MRDPRDVLTSIYLPTIIYGVFTVYTSTYQSVSYRVYNIAVSMVGILGLQQYLKESLPSLSGPTSVEHFI